LKATFKKGIHPKSNKELTKGLAFEIMEPGERVYIPISQHIGAFCTPTVNKGDLVKAGTLIAVANGFVSANVYSSVSGEVEGFAFRECVLGNKIRHIIIKNDGRYEEERLPVIEEPSAKDIINRVKEAGIVGMGGAAFPTHVKLSPCNPVSTLIINGAECEPYITADYRLMLERPEEIIAGIKLLQKALGAEKAILGIEDNKPDAIEVMKRHAGDIEVVAVATKYPQGGEKQLIYALTGLEVPKGKLPADVGCVVDNVATALATYEAVTLGKTSYQRYMTVTGGGIKNPKNLYVRTGMPFEEIAERLGKNEYRKVISGGPMMGVPQANLNAVVVKATSCLLLMTEEEISHSTGNTCINCARCHRACPMNLMPMLLDAYAQKGDLDLVEKYDVCSCIECGCCAYVCPARIPLVQSMRLGKKLLKERKK
jgi:electron transport complex protein RnfC